MSKRQKKVDGRFYEDVAQALGDIVRYSHNEHFRIACLEALSVDSTKALEEKLVMLLKVENKENNYQHCSQTQNIYLSEQANLRKPKEVEVTPKKCDEKQTLTMGNKHWLQVSSQPRKNTINRNNSSPSTMCENPLLTRTHWSQPCNSARKQTRRGSCSMAPQSSYLQSPDIRGLSSFTPLYQWANLSLFGESKRIIDVPEETRRALFTGEDRPSSPITKDRFY